MTTAELGFKIDSSPAAAAVRELEKLTASARKAEDQYKRIERAAAMAGGNQKAYAQAVQQAYGIQEQLGRSQLQVIRNYETLIAKTELLNAGHKREAAQLVALRQAGTTANTQYGRTVAALAGQLHDLEQQQGRTDRTAGGLANTLTRRFVLGFLVLQIREMARAVFQLNAELAKVQDTASRTGVNAGNLQGFQTAAQYKGVGASEFLDSMLKFNAQVTEAQRGLGDLARLFRVNGVAAKGTEDAFLKVADLVRNARTEADKFSILQQAGLPASREFVKLMEQGADAIRRQASEAATFTDAQLQRAKEIDEQWNKVWTDLTRRGKQAALEIMDPKNWTLNIHIVPGSIADRILNFARDAGRAVNGLPAAPAPSRDSIIAPELDLTGGMPGLTRTNTNASGRPTVDPEVLQRMNALEQQRLSILSQVATVGQQVRQVELQIAQARLQGINITKSEADNLVRMAKERALGIDQIKAQADSYRIEAETIGMSAGQAAAYAALMERINEAKRRGAPLSEENIELIRREAEEMGKAIDKAKELREMRDAAADFGKTFVTAMMDGKSAAEALSASVSQLGKNLVNKGVDKAVDGLFSADPGKMVGGLVQVGIGWGLDALTGRRKKEREAEQRRMEEERRERQRQQARQREDVMAQLSLRSSLIGLDTSTQAGALRQFDLQAEAEIRQTKAQSYANPALINQLEATLAQERLQIIKDFAKQAADAEAERLKSYEDRIFNALTDTSTLEGALAAFDRQAERQREEEIKAGGGAIAKLEEALGLERMNIQKEFNDRLIEEQKRAAEEMLDIAKGIREYLDSIKFGSLSTLSPAEQLAAARSTYEKQLGLAQSGDKDALAGITQAANPYLEQLRSFYGPSKIYGDIYAAITGELEALAKRAELAGGMRFGGIVGAMAGGGMVGNGIWNQDSVLARYAGGGAIALAGGEYVMPAAQTAANMSALQAMHRGAPSNENRELLAEVKALRAENKQIAGTLARLLSDNAAATREGNREIAGLRTDTRQSKGEGEIRNKSAA